MNIRTRFSRSAGVTLIAAAILYLLAELTSALAWTHPPYSYANDYISDLGVPGPSEFFLNHVINSPAAWIMNAGFIVNGVLVFVAVASLLRLRAGVKAKILFALVIVYAVGIVLVGSFHGSKFSAEHGLSAYHAVGALMAFGGGNVLLIFVGAFRRVLGVRKIVGVVAIVLGSVGTACLLLGGSVLTAHPGILERGSVYPIMAFQLIAGVSLIVFSFRRSASVVPLVSHEGTTDLASSPSDASLRG